MAMRINFICLDLGINGGTKSIIDMANTLHSFGHTVNIVYPKYVFPSIFNHDFKNIITAVGIPTMRLKRQLLGNNLSDKIPELFPVTCNLVKVPTLDDKYIPDADFTFATWWETASYVKKLSPSKGKKCYFIQHYETWGGKKEKVDETYKMGFINIVNSVWIANQIKINTGVDVDACITHVPNHDVFNFKDIRGLHEKEVRVVMLHRNIKWKGMEYGIKAFELAKEKFPNMKLILLGELNKKLAEKYEFWVQPDSDGINTIYNTCDIFIFPSTEEGFGLPPMEAMCTKIAVVSTAVGAVPDYSIDGHTALLSEPKDVNTMAEHIYSLAINKDLRLKLGENAYNKMQDYTWEKSARIMEEVLKKC